MPESKKRVFIHGSHGTTGLRIVERLQERSDLTLVLLSESERRDEAQIRRCLNEADIAFLCLPDEASRQAVAMVENPDTVLLDTSTAHRTDPAWTYGFPELREGQAGAIAKSHRIAVPGCHASGFIALIAPLTAKGLLSTEAKLSCFSLTGYSGGGKNMIAAYTDSKRSRLLDAPRQYAIGQQHKHLPEMMDQCQLRFAPIFCPIVADFYSGMEVSVPIFASDLDLSPLQYPHIQNPRAALSAFYAETYPGPVVRYIPADGEGGFMSAGALTGSDAMAITVTGNDDRLVLTARLDNLGKGASGAAVQCMNLVLGVDPTTGLSL